MDKQTSKYATSKVYGSNGATAYKPARMVYVDNTQRTNWLVVGVAVVIALALICGMVYMVVVSL